MQIGTLFLVLLGLVIVLSIYVIFCSIKLLLSAIAYHKADAEINRLEAIIIDEKYKIKTLELERKFIKELEEIN